MNHTRYIRTKLTTYQGKLDSEKPMATGELNGLRVLSLVEVKQMWSTSAASTIIGHRAGTLAKVVNVCCLLATPNSRLVHGVSENMYKSLTKRESQSIYK